MSNKVVSVFQCPEAGNQCPVYVLDLYAPVNCMPHCPTYGIGWEIVGDWTL